jgi:hypothetical protein
MTKPPRWEAAQSMTGSIAVPIDCHNLTEAERIRMRRDNVNAMRGFSSSLLAPDYTETE